MSKLAMTLWDFSWYTRTGPGEPFEDLDRAFTEAVERGYNAVRICAMPFLLFRSGLDTSALTFESFGGEYGQRTRWYDVRGRTTLNGRAHLLDFFRAAARHDVKVIVSSWEYQQSPSFSGDDAWHRALRAVPVSERPLALADAHADLVDLVKSEGLADTVAFVELHNEVQVSALTEDGRFGGVVELRDALEAGIDRFKERHPSVPCTVNYAHVPIGELRGVPRNIDVAVFHPYVYGVLDQLIDEFALRDPSRPFPQERAYAELLRDGAPPLEDWQPAENRRWTLDATVMQPRELYAHDWCDPDKWDRWLYDRYGAHRVAMRAVLDLWLAAAADLASDRGVPLVFGEGWVGYTPLHTDFEEGPVGAEICEYAVRRSREIGAWGTIVCSNAAPHHPMWVDVVLQQRLTAEFLA
ncbi:cellulase-like family protein [Cryptosporangium sp. NPDC048952]|uniref:cellulase-like family protein n=1 Tax=Cryptosporangium sp. NPDC048952 TaxID=3363961 RepID=UPI00371D1EF0